MRIRIEARGSRGVGLGRGGSHIKALQTEQKLHNNILRVFLRRCFGRRPAGCNDIQLGLPVEERKGQSGA